MAIKASCTITLSCYRDTESITRYYKLQSSTAVAPTKPTSNPPSGWTDTEPSYTSGATSTLYFCDLTAFSDGTWQYSSVSKSSAYEAAKEAWNKAQTAQDRVSDLEKSEPLIVGTQTQATGAWTGVAPFDALEDGQKILYWLPYAGNGNATLNLTLSDSTTTGAVPCYYGGTTRLATHYPAGSMIRLTYRKNVTISGSTATYTGWWADANYDSGNTYDRTKYSGAIKAANAIVAGNIIVGSSNGYHHLKTGGAFDPSYPILYAASTIAASATGTNNYTTIPFTITTTQSITLTAYRAVYIKGVLAGTNFTPASTAPITQTVPTSDDGYYYLLLGTAYSATAMYLLAEHPIYRYKNGAFKTMAQIASECAAWAYNNNTLYIDGGNIYAGTVTAKALAAKSVTAEKLNVRDLSAIGASIGNWEITETAITKTVQMFVMPDWEDMQNIKDLILANSWTSQQLAWYDYTCDGKLDLIDMLQLKRVLLEVQSMEDIVSRYGYELPLFDVTITISPLDTQQTIKMQTVAYGRQIIRYYGMGGMETAKGRFAGLSSTLLEVEEGTIADLTCTSLQCTSLSVSGTQETFSLNNSVKKFTFSTSEYPAGSIVELTVTGVQGAAYAVIVFSQTLTFATNSSTWTASGGIKLSQSNSREVSFTYTGTSTATFTSKIVIK